MKTRRQARNEAMNQAPGKGPSSNPSNRLSRPKKKVKKEVKNSKSISPEPTLPNRTRAKRKSQKRVSAQSPEHKQRPRGATSLEVKPTKKQLKQAEELKRKQKQEKQLREKKEKVKQAKKETTQSQNQVKRIVVKGAAPVDEYVQRRNKYHVLVHQNKVYSATLNQTNVSHNNNKYYIMQIVQADDNPNHNYLFLRWGRVGSHGQKSFIGPSPIAVAIREYEKKYHQKHSKGDYREVQLNYGSDEQEEKQQESNVDKKIGKINQYSESKLNSHVKDLLNLIFDLNMMNEQMKEIGYNVSKMPLGKLSKESIKKGYSILKELNTEVNGQKREEVINNLTNDFYSYIPHDVGFQNMAMFKLNTTSKVKDKLEMLQSLSEIKIATEILSAQDDGNKFDSNYKKLNRDISYVERESLKFRLIQEYLQTTHASTHRNYDLELVDLFELDSETENARFTKGLHNRMLLWHGSRLTNYVGILSQGLRIAPPEAPVTGYMFGKGVYFADMSSKSANYCCTSRENSTGILILCEAALGNMNQKFHADYYASNLPEGKHSTKGVGRTAPKVDNYQNLEGSILPMGPGFPTEGINTSLLYNEYIVYNINQIRIKYLLRTKFHYTRR